MLENPGAVSELVRVANQPMEGEVMPYSDPAKRREWYKRKREIVCQQQRARYHTNPDPIRKAVSEYQKRNRAKINMRNKALKARRILAAVNFERKAKAQRFPKGLFDREGVKE